LVFAINEQLKTAMQRFSKDANVISGAKNFLSRLSKLKTSSQLASFLHTAGSTIGMTRRSGTVIRVQPTSIQRRASGRSRGAKRLAVVRPSGVRSHRNERARNLAENIEKNQPNAKGHG